VLLRDAFAGALHGKRLTEASAAVAEVANSAPRDIADLVIAVAAVLVETLVEREEDRLVLGGTSNLARAASDFSADLGGMDAVLEALEEQVVVLKLLARTSRTDRVTVQIDAQRQPARCVGGVHRVRCQRHRTRQRRRAGADADGLPEHHCIGCCGGQVRWRGAGRPLTVH